MSSGLALGVEGQAVPIHADRHAAAAATAAATAAQQDDGDIDNHHILLGAVCISEEEGAPGVSEDADAAGDANMLDDIAADVRDSVSNDDDESLSLSHQDAAYVSSKHQEDEEEEEEEDSHALTHVEGEGDFTEPTTATDFDVNSSSVYDESVRERDGEDDYDDSLTLPRTPVKQHLREHASSSERGSTLASLVKKFRQDVKSADAGLDEEELDLWWMRASHDLQTHTHTQGQGHNPVQQQQQQQLSTSSSQSQSQSNPTTSTTGSSNNSGLSMFFDQSRLREDGSGTTSGSGREDVDAGGDESRMSNAALSSSSAHVLSPIQRLRGHPSSSSGADSDEPLSHSHALLPAPVPLVQQQQLQTGPMHLQHHQNMLRMASELKMTFPPATSTTHTHTHAILSPTQRLQHAVAHTPDYTSLKEHHDALEREMEMEERGVQAVVGAEVEVGDGEIEDLLAKWRQSRAARATGRHSHSQGAGTDAGDEEEEEDFHAHDTSVEENALLDDVFGLDDALSGRSSVNARLDRITKRLQMQEGGLQPHTLSQTTPVRTHTHTRFQRRTQRRKQQQSLSLSETLPVGGGVSPPRSRVSRSTRHQDSSSLSGGEEGGSEEEASGVRKERGREGGGGRVRSGDGGGGTTSEQPREDEDALPVRVPLVQRVQNKGIQTSADELADAAAARAPLSPSVSSLLAQKQSTLVQGSLQEKIPELFQQLHKSQVATVRIRMSKGAALGRQAANTASFATQADDEGMCEPLSPVPLHTPIEKEKEEPEPEHGGGHRFVRDPPSPPHTQPPLTHTRDEKDGHALGREKEDTPANTPPTRSPVSIARPVPVRAVADAVAPLAPPPSSSSSFVQQQQQQQQQQEQQEQSRATQATPQATLEQSLAEVVARGLFCDLASFNKAVDYVVGPAGPPSRGTSSPLQGISPTPSPPSFSPMISERRLATIGLIRASSPKRERPAMDLSGYADVRDTADRVSLRARRMLHEKEEKGGREKAIASQPSYSHPTQQQQQQQQQHREGEGEGDTNTQPSSSALQDPDPLKPQPMPHSAANAARDPHSHTQQQQQQQQQQEEVQQEQEKEEEEHTHTHAHVQSPPFPVDGFALAVAQDAQVQGLMQHINALKQRLGRA